MFWLPLCSHKVAFSSLEADWVEGKLIPWMQDDSRAKIPPEGSLIPSHVEPRRLRPAPLERVTGEQERNSSWQHAERFHCRSTFFFTPKGLVFGFCLVFLFLGPLSPLQFGSQQGWSSPRSRGARRKYLQRLSIFILRTGKAGVSGMFTVHQET